MTSTAEHDTDLDLLRHVEQLASGAGDRLLSLFSTSDRPADGSSLIAAVRANEAAASAGLTQALRELRPQARVLDGAQETLAIPDGEWWVVDPVEGNVNHVHGLDRWGVSITLVRDGAPVLAVVRQPVGDRTYTAVAGRGASLGDQAMRASPKESMEIAIVETGQAEAGQQSTYQRIGQSVTAMLHAALAVRVQVPSTFPMLSVAAGHTDAFWQYQPHLPGVAAGVLMVTEAGGVVTTITGEPWAPGADTILVAAPGVHAAAVAALAGVQ